MPSKKSARGQRQRTQKQIRLLKEAGLISKRVDARRRPTGATRSALRKFADVLTGKAKAVRVPKAVARTMRDSHRVKGDVVVIEREKGERVRYDPHEGAIVGTRKTRGKKFTRRIEREPGKMKPPRAGTKRYYVVPFQRSGGDIDYVKFDDWKELVNFMQEYEKTGYKKWRNYIEVVDVESRAELNEEYPGTYKRSRKPRVKARGWRK